MNATLPRPLQLLIDFGTWLITVAITLIGLAALTFFIGRVLPIDPVLSIVGEKATPEVYQRVYLELGLDKLIIVGPSLGADREAAQRAMARFPAEVLPLLKG